MAKKFVDLAVITIAGVTSFVDVAGVPKDATVNYIYTETTPTTPQETTADLMTINLYYIADRNDAGIYTGGEWEYMAIASVVSDVSEIEGGGSGDCYAVIKETESIIGTWVINETITPFSTNIDTLNIIGTVGISDVTDNTFETVYYAYNGTSADVGIQLLLGDDHNVIYYLDDNHNPKLTGSIGYIENTGVVYKSSFNPTVKNRTITITGGADITNDTFVIWLKANATKQEETPTKKFTRLYIGETVATSGKKVFKKLTTEKPTESVVGTWLLNTNTKDYYYPTEITNGIRIECEGKFYANRTPDVGGDLVQYDITYFQLRNYDVNHAYFNYTGEGNYNRAELWMSDTYDNGDFGYSRQTSSTYHNYSALDLSADDYKLIRTVVITAEPTGETQKYWLSVFLNRNATKIS